MTWGPEAVMRVAFRRLHAYDHRQCHSAWFAGLWPSAHARLAAKSKVPMHSHSGVDLITSKMLNAYSADARAALYDLSRFQAQ